MESRLPKRKIAVSASDRARIAANHIKFGEAFPRVPLATVNPDNPPLYQSMRTRATSPDPRHNEVKIDRHNLRRSRSISDLTHTKIQPLKRGAAGTVDSIPAKLARMNAVLPKATSSSTIASTKPTIVGNALKGTTNGIASKTTTSKATTSGALSTFKRPAVKPAVAGASIVKSNLMLPRLGRVNSFWSLKYFFCSA